MMFLAFTYKDVILKYFGYVSSANACDKELQADALKLAGCEQVFFDEFGQRSERSKLFKTIKSGDTLMVWRLDKFVCSVQDLVEQLEHMKVQGISFKALQENLDPEAIDDPERFHELVPTMADIERKMEQGKT
ncbi:hypothetical protein EA007_05755 [Vibrio anguillarum]|nr:hypothetical protein [Vibrio anguillarum]